MARTNIHGLKPGDTYTFTNGVGATYTNRIARVEEKSCYIERCPGHVVRQSWGTVNEIIELYNAVINHI